MFLKPVPIQVLKTSLGTTTSGLTSLCIPCFQIESELDCRFLLHSSAFHIHFSLHKKYMPIHTSGRILTAKERFQNRITDLYLVYVSCLRPSRGLSFAGLPRLFVKRWNEAESFTIYTNLQSRA